MTPSQKADITARADFVRQYSVVDTQNVHLTTEEMEGRGAFLAAQAALMSRDILDVLLPALAAQERKEQGYQSECHEVEQRLGKALGYPWYKDDQKNFPNATEADGVCIGEHTPGTIAHEAANRLAAQERECADWRDRAARLQHAYEVMLEELKEAKAKMAAQEERIVAAELSLAIYDEGRSSEYWERYPEGTPAKAAIETAQERIALIAHGGSVAVGDLNRALLKKEERIAELERKYDAAIAARNGAQKKLVSEQCATYRAEERIKRLEEVFNAAATSFRAFGGTKELASALARAALAPEAKEKSDDR